VAKHKSLNIPEDRRYYKGFIISYPAVQLDPATWAVALTSNEHKLQVKLGSPSGETFYDSHSLEGAISKAKQRVDELM
jgi:hypothetical protein